MFHQYLLFPGGKPKAVTFSYDDGSIHDIRLSRTLNKYKLKGTFNINSTLQRIDKTGGHIPPEQLREILLDAGHEIAVHGAEHRAPGTERPIEIIKDVLNCRLELEALLGNIVRGMAYPNSGIRQIASEITSYAEIRQNLKELGIVYSRSLGADNDSFALPNDWYNWIPTAHHGNPEIMRYIDEFLQIDLGKINPARGQPKLFYIWGHSFEFEQEQNWDLLETICEKLSGHEDVWYATNLEIYDYVKAYESLIYSASGHRILNPGRIDVWIHIDGKAYRIAPGETVEIPVA